MSQLRYSAYIDAIAHPRDNDDGYGYDSLRQPLPHVPKKTLWHGNYYQSVNENYNFPVYPGIPAPGDPNGTAMVLRQGDDPAALKDQHDFDDWTRKKTTINHLDIDDNLAIRFMRKERIRGRRWFQSTG